MLRTMTFYIVAVMSGLLGAMPLAYAQGLNFSLEFNYTDNNAYQFVKETDKEIKRLLLFGDLESTPQAYVPNDRFNFGKDFEGYIRHHFETATNGLFGNPADRNVDIIAGDESFFSLGLNKGNDAKRGKLAGFALDMGGLTFGGGYTWNEENPALMRDETKGMILGMAYNKKEWALQASVLSSGFKAAGLSTGGDRYDSVMIGGSWMTNEKQGYTATMQYQNDGQHDGAALFTVGTKFKF